MTFQRIFIPGSKWVYFKIYTGNKTSDSILVNSIHAYLLTLKQKGLLQKWFFIRYRDPDYHLRFRVLAKKQSDVGEIIALFYQYFKRLIANKIIWKIQLDSYNREIERYNLLLMTYTETIFYHDSENILDLLQESNCFKNNPDYRWMIAIKKMDLIFSAFGLQIEQKIKIVENLAYSFKKEFGFDKFNSKQFNSKYRENRSIIESILDDTFQEIDFNHLLVLTNKMIENSKSVIKTIMKIARINSIALDSIIVSYIHMGINRLFIGRNRQYELLLYDFLSRYYKSKLAQNKYRKRD